MQVSNPLLPGLTLQPLSTAARPVVESWTVGQLLQATVVAPVEPHRVTLLIGGSRMEAETNSPLRPGQQLSLRVERHGEAIVLRVVPEKVERRDVPARAMRSALPRQAPLPPLLANLTLLAKSPGQVPHESAPTWGELARTLLNSLPRHQALTEPSSLQGAMSRSGTFFESTAAQAARGTQPFPFQDFKAGLFRFIGLLSRTEARSPSAATNPAAAEPLAAARETPGPMLSATRPSTSVSAQTPATEQDAVRSPDSRPPHRGSSPEPQRPAFPTLAALSKPEQIVRELRGQLEGAVSRIQLHQLNSLSGDEGAKPVWSMEIPVRREEQTDVWSVRIEEEATGRGEAAGKRWCVSLAFELETLGPVHVRVALQSDKVSANVWAERLSTAELFTLHAPELADILNQAGLTVGNIVCVQGHPPRAEGQALPAALINVEA